MNEKIHIVSLSELARESQMKIILDAKIPKILRNQAVENMAKLDGTNGLDILVEAPVPQLKTLVQE